MAWSSRSPRDIFQGVHYPQTGPMDFAMGEAKRGALVEKGKGPW